MGSDAYPAERPVDRCPGGRADSCPARVLAGRPADHLHLRRVVQEEDAGVVLARLEPEDAHGVDAAALQVGAAGHVHEQEVFAQLVEPVLDRSGRGLGEAADEAGKVELRLVGGDGEAGVAAAQTAVLTLPNLWARRVWNTWAMASSRGLKPDTKS